MCYHKHYLRCSGEFSLFTFSEPSKIAPEFPPYCKCFFFLTLDSFLSLPVFDTTGSWIFCGLLTQTVLALFIYRKSFELEQRKSRKYWSSVYPMFYSKIQVFAVPWDVPALQRHCVLACLLYKSQLRINFHTVHVQNVKHLKMSLGWWGSPLEKGHCILRCAFPQL